MVTEGAWEEGVLHLGGEGVFRAEGTSARGPQPSAWTDSCPAVAPCAHRSLSDLLAAEAEEGVGSQENTQISGLHG